MIAAAVAPLTCHLKTLRLDYPHVRLGAEVRRGYRENHPLDASLAEIKNQEVVGSDDRHFRALLIACVASSVVQTALAINRKLTNAAA